MKFIKLTTVIAALIFILSCNQQNSKSPELQEMAIQRDIETNSIANNVVKNQAETADNKPDLFKTDPADKQQIPQKKKEDQKKQPTADQATKPDWDKKIIKTASVNLEVKDYDSYYTTLREKVKNLGGYIAQEEQTQSDYKVENSMTIKVPVDQFDNAIVLLTTNVQKINERKINSQDVTTEVVDTKSRMEAKKQVRQRYMDLLGQAKNMEEILNVQSEVNAVQEEIESAAGRIEYLSHSSVFSSINLTYYQVLNSSAKEPGNEKTPSFGEKVKGALGTGWEIVSNLFIGIITLWPLILGSFFAFLLYKKLRGQKTTQA